MARITLVVDVHFRRVRWDRLACVSALRLRLAGTGSKAKAPTAGRKRPINEQLKQREVVSTRQQKHESDVETGVGLEAGR